MSISSKAIRRYEHLLCRVAITAFSPSAEEIRTAQEEIFIAQQKATMWYRYRAELERIARTPVGEPEPESFIPHEDISEDSSVAIADDGEPTAPAGYARFEITDSGPSHFYPTGKGKHTSKSKRYNPTVKKSDQAKSKKFHGKPKGRPYSKLRKNKTPLLLEDF